MLKRERDRSGQNGLRQRDQGVRLQYGDTSDRLRLFPAHYLFLCPKRQRRRIPIPSRRARYPAYFHLEQILREGYHGRLFLGTTKKQDIILSTDNDNSFDWAIPSSLPAGSNFKIKITTLDGKIMATGSNFVLN